MILYDDQLTIIRMLMIAITIDDVTLVCLLVVTDVANVDA